VRLVFVPLPNLLVHEVFQAVLPVLLRFLSARSATARGHILTSAEEALQPHRKRDSIRPLALPSWGEMVTASSAPDAQLGRTLRRLSRAPSRPIRTPPTFQDSSEPSRLARRARLTALRGA